MNNFLKALIFGLLAVLFGMIQFNIPGIKGSVTSLNEVPMLISVLYIRHPLYLVVVTFFLSLNNPPDGSLWTTLVMHIGGLIPFWYYYHKFIRVKFKKTFVILPLFFLGSVLYYLMLVLPLLVITHQLFQINTLRFDVFYFKLVYNTSFEILTTSIIVTLYLLQYNTHRKLKEHINSVEKQIEERTFQLASANEELNAANEELKSLNNHLDSLVLERTQELENRNIQLSGYAFVNSHLLRAPLARILGLSNIIAHELTRMEDKILIEKFLESCKELDKIVNLINEIVTEETVLSNSQIEDLQEKIRMISNGISARN